MMPAMLPLIPTENHAQWPQRGKKDSEAAPVHVLVVDDDEAFGWMVEKAIGKLTGFACSFVSGAEEALRFLKERIVDVVIADIRMPDMDGLKLTRIIKEQYAADVIVITGFYDSFTYEEAVEHGASDFIEKPVRPTELVIRLKRVLRERALSCKRQQAEEEREESVARLRKALRATVQALAVTAETRDPYTAGHQRRVADLARSIATAMGLAAERIDGIRMASTIHDLGKISVPTEILSKPTKLTDIELMLIKTHVQSGFDILKDIDFPWPIAQMVLEHHERIDGSGYPHGLMAGQLLIESRIIAVADVVEAIASHRPYRPGLGIAESLEEITRNKGILYDADVVGASVQLFREGNYKLALL